MFFLWPIRDEFGVKKVPFVNYTIIVFNVVIYLVFGLDSCYQEIVNAYGFIPSRFSWLTIFTSMFLHGSLMHLIRNMWYLYLMGDNLEDRWGHFNYLIFYLFSGVIAALFYGALTTGSARNIPSIGASGAISGVLGAYLMLFPRSRITFWYYLFAFFRIYSGTFEIFAWFWISFWFIQQIIGMFANMNSTATAGIAFGAHVGGFLAGIGIAFLTRTYQVARYTRNVCSGRNALAEITGEVVSKILPFEQQIELYKKEKEIEKLLEENNEREAAIVYGDTLKKFKDVSIPHSYEYKFAEMLQEMGLYEQAIEAYRRFLRRNPFSLLADNALYNLGKIYLEKNEKKKARECFMQIVFFYPYSELQEQARYALSNINVEPALLEK
ncbi:MAG: rhomboid family intramembrane serine protease [Candidatus Omnitrophica bacterium]|nr:rhomboid family intramembrane serine protease [Candidatus Omnitrophota bacterium]